MHRGVDFMASEGTRVYATADGTVSAVNSRKGASSGISVTITHGKSGYKTFYGHLSRASVKRGQRVRQGDIIGLTGNSGLSFVPHLHYEVLFNDVQVDPLYYFFKEVPPWDMQRLRSIASTGMQSLD
jgi:murein DD-endopeptidase MepM/ murein hydrolase activator NlpD